MGGFDLDRGGAGVRRSGRRRRRAAGADLPQRYRQSAGLEFSGPWKLDGKPGDCGEARCHLQEIATVGGSRWYLRESQWGEEADFDVQWSGDLIEKKPNGQFWAVWRVSGDGTLSVLGEAKILVFEKETYLLVPIYLKGNGGIREDQLFHWKTDHWQQVETESWWYELKMPSCYTVRRSFSVDFERLAWERDLFIEGVAGLKGATSATIEVKFRLHDDRLEIASWQIAEEDNSWSEQPAPEPIRCGSKIGPCPPCFKTRANRH